MALQDPVMVYIALNNVELALVREMFLNEGINAFSVDDVSPVAGWIGGLASQIHRPKLWVERGDVDRAKLLLGEFERKNKSRLESTTSEGSVDAACEDCGKTSTFPAALRGSVQNCAHCGGFIDVDLDDDDEDFDVGEADDESAAEPSADEN